MFAWIRRMVARAVVEGFNDGCAAIATNDQPESLEDLRALIARPETKALPVSEGEEPPRTRKGK